MKKVYWAGIAGVLALGTSAALLTGAASPPGLSTTLAATTVMNQGAFNNNPTSATAAETALNASLSSIENAQLQLSVSPQGTGFAKATVSGTLIVGSASLPLTFGTANLAQMTTSTGPMDFGPVDGSMTLPNGKAVSIILGPFFIPGTDNAQASLTIGDIGVPVHLFFGVPFVRTSWNAGMIAAERQLASQLSANAPANP